MSSVPTEEQLDELLLRWDELRGQGRDVSAGELCVGCPELAEELRRRIAVIRGLEPVLDVEPTHLVSTPEDGGPDDPGPDRRLPDDLQATAVYQPQRFHAQGGLGEVLAVRQEELDRTVALKRIRPDKLHEAARRRFLREATITAGLQHPGIVPIYGLGRDEDGPFYTMPFIEGRTLQEAIDAFHGEEALGRDPGRRALEFRGLVQQFIAVCNTMAYAHNQGVIHRDLKPSNIMLGPYGETLVMDWGLAKRLGVDDAGGEADGDAPSPSPWPDALTATGTVLGTPHYMSPEQARGEPAGPASDVFCLGLVLYAILTGKSPYADAVLQGGDLQRAVREAEVVPPRRRDQGLHGALEAICLKALATRPEDRYSSPRTLADDLSKWLADEPVGAWREPWTSRARRWMGRHRTPVAAAAVGLVIGAAGLAVTLMVETKAKEDLRAAFARESRSNRVLRAALEREQRANGLALKAMEGYSRAAGVDDLLKEPRLLGLRRDLLGRGLQFYRELQVVLESGQDSKTRADLADAYASIGRISRELGAKEDAFGAYQQALSIFEALLRADPGSADLRGRLAAIYNEIGIVERSRSEALRRYEQARSICEASPDSDIASRRELARALRFIGLSRSNSRPDEALRLLRRAQKIDEGLVRDDPTNLAAYRGTVECLITITALETASGQSDEAWRTRCRALEALQGMESLEPNDPETRRCIARLYIAIADVEVDRSDPVKASPPLQRADKIVEELLADDPVNLTNQSLLSTILIKLGDTYFETSRQIEALGSYQRALRVIEQWMHLDPTRVAAKGLMAWTLERSGWIHRELGRADEAAQSLRRALAIREELASDPDNGPEIDLGVNQASIGRLNAELGRIRAALRAYRRTRDLIERDTDVRLSVRQYNLACVHSLCHALADRDDGQLTPEERSECRASGDLAMASLGRAIAFGYRDIAQIHSDSDLAPLRSRPDFKALLMDLSFPAEPFADCEPPVR